MLNSGALENRISVFVSKRRLHLIHHRELFGATRRVAFPVTAARTLPIELLGFEAAMAALIARQFLCITTYERFDQREFSTTFRWRRHQSGFK